MRWRIAGLALFLVACGGNDQGSLTVRDPWARTSPPGSDTSAFYLEVDNPLEVADRLVAADSPRCSRTELHVSEMTDGTMSMHPATPEQLTVPSGATLLLEPGGLHVMCMGVTDPLTAGEEVALTLSFEIAGDLDVDVSVEDR